MTTTLSFIVRGQPVPQGSKTPGIRRDGRPFVRNSNDKTLIPWRQEVTAIAARAAAEQGWVRLEDGPVAVTATFYLERPATDSRHYGSRDKRPYLRPDAPVWCDKAKGDADKLARSLLDALVYAELFRDDAQVADLHVLRKWAGGRHAELKVPGAVVAIAPAGPAPGVRGLPGDQPAEEATLI